MHKRNTPSLGASHVGKSKDAHHRSQSAAFAQELSDVASKPGERGHMRTATFSKDLMGRFFDFMLNEDTVKDNIKSSGQTGDDAVPRDVDDEENDDDDDDDSEDEVDGEGYVAKKQADEDDEEIEISSPVALQSSENIARMSRLHSTVPASGILLQGSAPSSLRNSAVTEKRTGLAKEPDGDKEDSDSTTEEEGASPVKEKEKEEEEEKKKKKQQLENEEKKEEKKGGFASSVLATLTQNTFIKSAATVWKEGGVQGERKERGGEMEGNGGKEETDNSPFRITVSSGAKGRGESFVPSVHSVADDDGEEHGEKGKEEIHHPTIDQAEEMRWADSLDDDKTVASNCTFFLQLLQFSCFYLLLSFSVIFTIFYLAWPSFPHVPSFRPVIGHTDHDDPRMLPCLLVVFAMAGRVTNFFSRFLLSAHKQTAPQYKYGKLVPLSLRRGLRPLRLMWVVQIILVVTYVLVIKLDFFTVDPVRLQSSSPEEVVMPEPPKTGRCEIKKNPVAKACKSNYFGPRTAKDAFTCELPDFQTHFQQLLNTTSFADPKSIIDDVSALDWISAANGKCFTMVFELFCSLFFPECNHQCEVMPPCLELCARLRTLDSPCAGIFDRDSVFGRGLLEGGDFRSIVTSFIKNKKLLATLDYLFIFVVQDCGAEDNVSVGKKMYHRKLFTNASCVPLESRVDPITGIVTDAYTEEMEYRYEVPAIRKHPQDQKMYDQYYSLAIPAFSSCGMIKSREYPDYFEFPPEGPCPNFTCTGAANMKKAGGPGPCSQDVYEQFERDTAKALVQRREYFLLDQMRASLNRAVFLQQLLALAGDAYKEKLFTLSMVSVLICLSLIDVVWQLWRFRRRVKPVAGMAGLIRSFLSPLHRSYAFIALVHFIMGGFALFIAVASAHSGGDDSPCGKNYASLFPASSSSFTPSSVDCFEHGVITWAFAGMAFICVHMGFAAFFPNQRKSLMGSRVGLRCVNKCPRSIRGNFFVQVLVKFVRLWAGLFGIEGVYFLVKARLFEAVEVVSQIVFFFSAITEESSLTMLILLGAITANIALTPLMLISDIPLVKREGVVLFDSMFDIMIMLFNVFAFKDRLASMGFYQALGLWLSVGIQNKRMKGLVNLMDRNLVKRRLYTAGISRDGTGGSKEGDNKGQAYRGSVSRTLGGDNVQRTSITSSVTSTSSYGMASERYREDEDGVSREGEEEEEEDSVSGGGHRGKASIMLKPLKNKKAKGMGSSSRLYATVGSADEEEVGVVREEEDDEDYRRPHRDYDGVQLVVGEQGKGERDGKRDDGEEEESARQQGAALRREGKQGAQGVKPEHKLGKREKRKKLQAKVVAGFLFLFGVLIFFLFAFSMIAQNRYCAAKYGDIVWARLDRRYKVFFHDGVFSPMTCGVEKTAFSLSLAQLGLTTVPLSLAYLKQIESLDLSDNFITALSMDLVHVKSLRKITLKGNPIAVENARVPLILYLAWGKWQTAVDLQVTAADFSWLGDEEETKQLQLALDADLLCCNGCAQCKRHLTDIITASTTKQAERKKSKSDGAQPEDRQGEQTRGDDGCFLAWHADSRYNFTLMDAHPSNNVTLAEAYGPLTRHFCHPNPLLLPSLLSVYGKLPDHFIAMTAPHLTALSLAGHALDDRTWTDNFLSIDEKLFNATLFQQDLDFILNGETIDPPFLYTDKATSLSPVRIETDQELSSIAVSLRKLGTAQGQWAQQQAELAEKNNNLKGTGSAPPAASPLVLKPGRGGTLHILDVSFNRFSRLLHHLEFEPLDFSDKMATSLDHSLDSMYVLRSVRYLHCQFNRLAWLEPLLNYFSLRMRLLFVDFRFNLMREVNGLINRSGGANDVRSPANCRFLLQGNSVYRLNWFQAQIVMVHADIATLKETVREIDMSQNIVHEIGGVIGKLTRVTHFMCEQCMFLVAFHSNLEQWKSLQSFIISSGKTESRMMPDKGINFEKRFSFLQNSTDLRVIHVQGFNFDSWATQSNEYGNTNTMCAYRKKDCKHEPPSPRSADLIVPTIREFNLTACAVALCDLSPRFDLMRNLTSVDLTYMTLSPKLDTSFLVHNTGLQQLHLASTPLITQDAWGCDKNWTWNQVLNVVLGPDYLPQLGYLTIQALEPIQSPRQGFRVINGSESVKPCLWPIYHVTLTNLLRTFLSLDKRTFIVFDYETMFSSILFKFVPPSQMSVPQNSYSLAYDAMDLREQAMEHWKQEQAWQTSCERVDVVYAEVFSDTWSSRTMPLERKNYHKTLAICNMRCHGEFSHQVDRIQLEKQREPLQIFSANEAPFWKFPNWDAHHPSKNAIGFGFLSRKLLNLTEFHGGGSSFDQEPQTKNGAQNQQRDPREDIYPFVDSANLRCRYRVESPPDTIIALRITLTLPGSPFLSTSKAFGEFCDAAGRHPLRLEVYEDYNELTYPVEKGYWPGEWAARQREFQEMQEALLPLEAPWFGHSSYSRGSKSGTKEPVSKKLYERRYYQRRKLYDSAFVACNFNGILDKDVSDLKSRLSLDSNNTITMVTYVQTTSNSFLLKLLTMPEYRGQAKFAIEYEVRQMNHSRNDHANDPVELQHFSDLEKLWPWHAMDFFGDWSHFDFFLPNSRRTKNMINNYVSEMQSRKYLVNPDGTANKFAQVVGRSSFDSTFPSLFFEKYQVMENNWKQIYI